MAKKGFTMTELLVVVIIIGILAALALPNYLAIKEKSLNREAKASLALIRAAERIYRMEQGYYYPQSASTGVIADINRDLKLALPESASVLWSISLDSTGAPESVTATRPSDGRFWKQEFGSEDQDCTEGSVPGACN